MHARHALIAALVLAVAAPAAAQAPGWQALDLGGGRRATRYLPFSARACDALPLLLFLHGAGGTPEAYHSHLEAHAETSGFVLLLPQASGAGWSGADAATLNAALDAVAGELTIDVTRTYIGGHSAGGAFAYILAYDSTGFAGVFSMSVPYYAVSAVADPHRAPIHMYYGAEDPNYTGGSAAALEMQWARLGVTSATDVQAGFGHSTWPASSIALGFTFLAAQRYPGAPTPSTCGDVDAGMSVDASMGLDAGGAGDGGAIVSDAAGVDAGARDASSSRDAGGRGAVASGCGCRTGGRAPGALAWTMLALALACRAESRRRARPAGERA